MSDQQFEAIREIFTAHRERMDAIQGQIDSIVGILRLKGVMPEKSPITDNEAGRPRT